MNNHPVLLDEVHLTCLIHLKVHCQSLSYSPGTLCRVSTEKYVSPEDDLSHPKIDVRNGTEELHLCLQVG